MQISGADILLVHSFVRESRASALRNVSAIPSLFIANDWRSVSIKHFFRTPPHQVRDKTLRMEPRADFVCHPCVRAIPTAFHFDRVTVYIIVLQRMANVCGIHCSLSCSITETTPFTLGAVIHRLPWIEFNTPRFADPRRTWLVSTIRQIRLDQLSYSIK